MLSNQVVNLVTMCACGALLGTALNVLTLSADDTKERNSTILKEAATSIVLAASMCFIGWQLEYSQKVLAITAICASFLGSWLAKYLRKVGKQRVKDEVDKFQKP